MKNLPFLREFTGVLVHDHETALYHFGTGHTECNVHLLRYLKKNTEDTGHSWSGEMVSLLCSANRERNHQIAQGLEAFPAKERAGFEERYQELIRKGRKQKRGDEAQLRQKGGTDASEPNGKVSSKPSDVSE